MKSITLSEEESSLKKKAEMADNALVQLKLSLEDMRHRRLHRF